MDTNPQTKAGEREKNGKEMNRATCSGRDLSAEKVYGLDFFPQ